MTEDVVKDHVDRREVVRQVLLPLLLLLLVVVSSAAEGAPDPRVSVCRLKDS